MGKEEAAVALDAVIEAVMETLEAGDAVFLRGFGTFSVKRMAARQGRNIATGTIIQIPAKNIPAFKPAKAFQERV